MASGDNRKTVCVMDAAGVLGSALVERLLNKGCTVHAATQNISGEVMKRDESRRLKVFQSDPFDYRSILDAVRGCSGVFYSFEPPQTPAAVYDELMVEVEMRGAHNVLEACAHTPTMERVVFTSSITAVAWKEDRKPKPHFDERDWRDPNFCSKFKLWYALAKTLSERTAWTLAMDRGVNMVSINTGMLLAGPGLSLSQPYLKGMPEMYEDGVLVTVDLSFLVDTHIAVFESSSAHGRFICFNKAICNPEDVVKLMQTLAQSAPCLTASDELRISRQRIQCKKLNEVMVHFSGGRNVEEYKPLDRA